MTLGPVSGLHQDLAERRVSMYVSSNLGGRQLHALRQGQLGQQLGNIRADDVGAQDLAITSVCDDLDKPGIITQS